MAAHKVKKEMEASKTNPIPGLVIQNETKKKKKKSKSKGGGGGSTSAIAAVGTGAVASVTEDLAKATLTEEPSATKKLQTDNEKPKAFSDKSKSVTAPAGSGTPNKQISTVDPLKRLKNLRKKIREIESLEKKIKSGEIKNPDKEMLEKVSRKAEIQQEVKELEANQ